MKTKSEFISSHHKTTSYIDLNILNSLTLQHITPLSLDCPKLGNHIPFNFPAKHWPQGRNSSGVCPTEGSLVQPPTFRIQEYYFKGMNIE